MLLYFTILVVLLGDWTKEKRTFELAFINNELRITQREDTPAYAEVSRDHGRFKKDKLELKYI